MRSKPKTVNPGLSTRQSFQSPYRIKSIEYPDPGTTLEKEINEQHLQSTLAPGQNYDLAKMQSERKRITGELKDEGFFYFNERHMIFKADTTVGDRKVELFLAHTPNIPVQAETRYSIGRCPMFFLTIHYPQILLSAVTGRTLLNDYQFFARDRTIKPGAITDKLNIKTGRFYSREETQLSISRLMGLGVFKFVNINYKEDNTAAGVLDASVYLTPLLKKSLRVQLEAVSKSNDFIGPSISTTFLNRNAFGGAELFQLKFDFGFETQVSSQQNQAVNAIEFGVEASLEVPRFMTPVFTVDYSSKKYIPKNPFQNRLQAAEQD